MKVLLKIFCAILFLNSSAQSQWKDTSARTQIPEVQFRRDTTEGRKGGSVRDFEEQLGRQNTMLIEAGYVLKIRILEVAKGLDSTFNGGKHPHENVNVVCEVIDTIKGIKIPYNCYYPKPKNRKEREAFKKENRIQNCLKFHFSPRQYTGYIPPNVRCLPPGLTWRMREVLAGEEYYMFFQHIAIDSVMDVLVPLAHYEKGGGFFKIADGKVEDEEGFWGLGNLPLEKDFKEKLEKKVESIRKLPENWQYKTESLKDFKID
jgi:hypothetical protein